MAKTTKTSTSPSMSMKGWKLKIWLVRNKETFKLLGSALAGLSTYYLQFVPQPWNALLGVAASVAGKLVLDAFDYFLSDVAIKE